MSDPARIRVHCTPRSSRERIEAATDGEYGVRVTVPAEGGKANAAVCRLVAKAIGVPKSSVSVVRGAAARHKQLEIRDVDQDLAEDALARSADGSPGGD